MCVALVACWSGSSDQRTTPTSSELEPRARDLTGPYWCSIDQDGYDYPRYPCVIRKVGAKLVLAKLGGSQRLRGFVVASGDRFEFTGELYCPWGDCTEGMHGWFEPTGRGGFKGTLSGPLTSQRPGDAMVVHLRPAPANAFGGSSYGGDGYGDPFGYGGPDAGATPGRNPIDTPNPYAP
ncbi:MAG: hypothetical protein ACTHU0_26500 [Kofleriaceae bacterium]